MYDFSIARALRNAAASVWRTSSSAFNNSNFVLQEETMTENFLLDLIRQLPKAKFDAYLYSKSEEGRGVRGKAPTGADFRIAFSGADGSTVEFQVQAKRLFPNGKYDGLDKLDTQWHQLMTNNAGAFPLYLFYNFSPVFPLHLHSTDYSSGGRFRGPSFWGCAIAHPWTVYSKVVSVDTQAEIQKLERTLKGEIPVSKPSFPTKRYDTRASVFSDREIQPVHMLFQSGVHASSSIAKAALQSFETRDATLYLTMEQLGPIGGHFQLKPSINSTMPRWCNELQLQFELQKERTMLYTDHGEFPVQALDWPDDREKKLNEFCTKLNTKRLVLIRAHAERRKDSSDE